MFKEPCHVLREERRMESRSSPLRVLYVAMQLEAIRQASRAFLNVIAPQNSLDPNMLEDRNPAYLRA